MRPRYVLGISLLAGCNAHLYQGVHFEHEGGPNWNGGPRTCVQRYNQKDSADRLEGCLEAHFEEGNRSSSEGIPLSSQRSTTVKRYGILIDTLFKHWNYKDLDLDLRIGSAAQFDFTTGNVSFTGDYKSVDTESVRIPQADITFRLRPFIEQEFRLGYAGMRFGVSLYDYDELIFVPNMGIGITFPKDFSQK
ncbi:hypothetical protein HYV86_06695 [Candidatus Woesearchaeota archaeon]|nr:hypothetical protein [Candidatus Woesearchaeota archaeon]